MGDSPFEVGDEVQLKSGGPVMTVASEPMANPKGQHRCTWFDGGELREGYFLPGALKPFTGPPDE